MTDFPSRRLYLVRHGEAKPKAEDPERGLTQAGHTSVSRMGVWVDAAGIRVDEIRHSGKLRAKQTAEIVAEPLGVQARETAGLAPNDDVVVIAKEIETQQGDIMLVGHLPFLERLAALLTVGNAETSVVNLEAGALLELTADDNGWSVSCLMQPRLVPAA